MVVGVGTMLTGCNRSDENLVNAWACENANDATFRIDETVSLVWFRPFIPISSENMGITKSN